MKKGQISDKMLRRFPVITRFANKYHRLPTNVEIQKMFKIAKNGIGETTKDILDKYQKSLINCTLCGHKWK